MSNISVVISAETADLAAKFAIARSQSSALTAELNRLAKQAATTGVGAELQPQLIQASEAMLTAKNRANELGAALKKVGDDSGSGMNNLRHELQGLMDPIRGVYNGVGELAEVFASLYVARGALDFANSIVKVGADLEEQSKVLGLSTDALQVFEKSANDAGVATDVVDVALKRFNEAQGLAQTGLGLQAKAFEDLGVSANLPAQEALPAIAKALLSITDMARRSRDEVALFGRSGEELNPVLAQWSRGTEALLPELQEQGRILNSDVAEGAENARIQMGKAWDQLVTNAAPALTATVGWLADLAGAFGNLTEATIKYQKVSDYNAAAFSKPIKLQGGILTDTQPLAGAASTAFPQGAINNTNTNNDDAAQAKAIEQARRIADEQTQIWQQASLARITGEQQTNASLLALGNETLEQFKAQATNLENVRYQIMQGGLQAREQIDKGDAVALARDMADEELLSVEHNNKLAEIDDQYALKSLEAQRQANDAADAQRMADFNKELAERKQQSELVIQGIEQTNAAIQAAAKGEMDQKKTELRQLTSAEDSFINGVLSGRQSLGQTMLQMAGTFLQQELAQDVKGLTARLVLGKTEADADKANGAMGLVWHELFEESKTGATIAGEAARLAVKSGSAIGSFVVEELAAQKSILISASSAAAKAFSGTMDIVPYPYSLIAAPLAAVGTFAAVEAWQQFETGTNSVPFTGPAIVHQGEMIIPAAQAAQIRDGDSSDSSGGSNQTVIIAPVYNVTAASPAAFAAQLKDHARDLAQIVGDHMRLNPSTRPAY